MASIKRIEWPTLVVMLGCYCAWAALTWFSASLSMWVVVPLLAVTLAMHSSLQHEALHGHPTRWPWLNEALVFPALGFFIPYRRFRDTHLAHHRNELLTDPYDDPESNYLDPKVWSTLPAWRRGLLTINNTLLGRMIVGPAVGTIEFWLSEIKIAARGDRAVLTGWCLHIAGLFPVFAWLSITQMSWLAYFLAAYLALSILNIRTFLEHRADERVAGRSVIIEDRGPLAFLFLNNNFHAVHHAHPKVAWYKLPALYRSRRDIFLRRNGGYFYPSYASIFSRHLLRAKDPVPHPLMDE